MVYKNIKINVYLIQQTNKQQKKKDNIMKIKEKIEKILIDVEDKYQDIAPGVWISTSEQIIKDQKEWSDEDEYKNFDFDTYVYWITNDGGTAPIGIDSADELENLNKEYLWLEDDEDDED